MKLYFARHGTTKWNDDGRLQGRKDSDLTEEGVYRAIQLRSKLANVNFDFVYSSPQNRALETAKIFRGNKDTKIITHESLSEIGLGIWEGMKISEIERDFPKEYHSYKYNPENYKPLGGESFEELFMRVQLFLDEIKRLDAENIMVITHGVTIKALLAIVKGLSLKEFSSIPVYTGTALNICECSKDKIELLIEGDTSHIHDL